MLYKVKGQILEQRYLFYKVENNNILNIKISVVNLEVMRKKMKGNGFVEKGLINLK